MVELDISNDNIIQDNSDLQLNSSPRFSASDKQEFDEILNNLADSDISNDVENSNIDEEAYKQEFDKFYLELTALSSFTKEDITNLLGKHFTDDSFMIKRALWDAKSASKNDELTELLNSMITSSFINILKDSKPKSVEDIRKILKSEFDNNRQRETALWQTWSDLKDIPAMNDVVGLVRQELSHLMIINGLIRHMINSTMKPKLDQEF